MICAKVTAAEAGEDKDEDIQINNNWITYTGSKNEDLIINTLYCINTLTADLLQANSEINILKLILFS